MNTDNYCTIEAAQKLIDNGIVLETDMVWMLVSNLYITLPDGNSPKCWKIIDKDNFAYFIGVSKGYEIIPAPSPAEVWRELPIKISNKFVTIDKALTNKDEEVTCAQYEDEGGYCNTFYSNTNLTDALIALLIWVRKEKK
jgi:hypothetical protein